MNGFISGEVYQERPWQRWKIVAVKRTQAAVNVLFRESRASLGGSVSYDDLKNLCPLARYREGKGTVRAASRKNWQLGRATYFAAPLAVLICF